MTRAADVHAEVTRLMNEGMSRSDAFKNCAESLGLAVNTIRGNFYRIEKGSGEGGSTRTRRRETTPEDAMADARKVVERAIQSIDQEVEAAQERASEMRAEADNLKETAKARKDAIQARLEALS